MEVAGRDGATGHLASFRLAARCRDEDTNRFTCLSSHWTRTPFRSSPARRASPATKRCASWRSTTSAFSAFSSSTSWASPKRWTSRRVSSPRPSTAGRPLTAREWRVSRGWRSRTWCYGPTSARCGSSHGEVRSGAPHGCSATSGGRAGRLSTATRERRCGARSSGSRSAGSPRGWERRWSSICSSRQRREPPRGYERPPPAPDISTPSRTA
jgi:hypothetical protein